MVFGRNRGSACRQRGSLSPLIIRRDNHNSFTLGLQSIPVPPACGEFLRVSSDGGRMHEESRAMSTPKPNGHGILKAARARHAEEAIGHSEGLVTVLRLTQTDMRPAEDTLKIAKDLFASQEYSKALAAARQAEAIAITLDERHSGYQKAARALRTTIEEMRRLGLHTEDLEAVLGRAEEKVLAGIWENRAFVPNYLEARVLLERANKDGRDLLDKATEASNQIFLAELATEALLDVSGPADPPAFADGAATDLESALHDATRELALGNVDGAIRIAKQIEATAGRRRSDYGEGVRVLKALETHLAD